MDWTTWAGLLVGVGGVAIWTLLRDTVLCSLKLFACFYTAKLVDFMYAPVEGLLDQIPNLPDDTDMIATGVGELAFCLNHWIPLFEIIGFEILLVYIWTSWIIIRLIKSFVPTLAN